jgi:hypothetical protein
MGNGSSVVLFWRQLEWIRPESYIADTHHLLAFASANRRVLLPSAVNGSGKLLFFADKHSCLMRLYR